MVEFSTMWQEALALLKQLISTPSFSKKEEQVADLIHSYLSSLKLPTERIGNNILFMNFNRYKEGETILLNSHLDTVKPSSSWSIDPFTPQIIGDKLYGLGSNDAGASLVSLLFTAIYLYEKGENIAFCASVEEEISGFNGISKVLQKYPNFKFAIIGEPTQMQPAVAEKGLMVLDGVSIGKSGHAAREEGDNAIYKLLNDLQWFKTYTFQKESPFLGPVKMNVTQIEAGSQHNVIPDKCTYVVDVRSNGCYSNQELLSIIQRNIQSTVTPRSTRLNSTMTPPDHPIFKRFPKLNMTPFGSPTLSDQALISFPSLKLGPGESARSHTADEYIKISEIKEAINTYIMLLTNLTI